jgi:hypothetical protein
MKKYGKKDANQDSIVDGLRWCGASVTSLASVGGGVPDLLIGYRGKNFIAEVKMPHGTLTEDQIEWHGSWRGKVFIWRTVADAILTVCGPKILDAYGKYLAKKGARDDRKDD